MALLVGALLFLLAWHFRLGELSFAELSAKTAKLPKPPEPPADCSERHHAIGQLAALGHKVLTKNTLPLPADEIAIYRTIVSAWIGSSNSPSMCRTKPTLSVSRLSQTTFRTAPVPLAFRLRVFYKPRVRPTILREAICPTHAFAWSMLTIRPRLFPQMIQAKRWRKAIRSSALSTMRFLPASFRCQKLHSTVSIVVPW
jgi:hypothetical protein